MFFTKSISISAVIVLASQIVSAKKCIYVQIGDNFDSHQNNYVECRNVNSMNELSSDIRSDWNRLKIVNDGSDDVFTTAGQFSVSVTDKGNNLTKWTILENTPSWEYVQNLDLSQAGTLQVAEYGFRGFSQLIQLNISSTQTTTLKNSWFSRSNSIQTLDVSWNRLNSLKQEDMRTLSKLLVANFSNNEIEEIERLAFSTLRQMKILNLRNNRIANVFDLGDLPSLEVLNLDDNFLEEVCTISCLLFGI